MSVAREMANVVAGRVSQKNVDKVVAFDPLTILAIISAIYQIVYILKACNVMPNQAVDKITNPGIVGRWKANRIIKRELKRKGKLDIYGEVKLAMYESGKNFDEGVINALYTETAQRDKAIQDC